MAVKLAFNDLPQFVDASGNPYSGGKMFTYVAGSSTKQTTYKDSAGATSNTNPIILDSAGRAPYAIWLTTGVSYKFVLAPSTDTDPPTSPIWTLDNVSGINDATVTLDQWVSGPAPTYISATSFSLVGDQTSTFQVGRRVKTTNSGGTVYSTITASSYGVLTTVTVANDSGTLDSGLSAVSYGLLSADNIATPAIFQRLGSSSGRLTLTSGVPVMTSDVTAATTVYFTPYNGNTVPVYDGGKFLQLQFAELSQATTDTTKSPAAVTTNSNYDLFVWNDAGTMRCTRGPAWSSSTARGTGAGTTELEWVKGVLVNKVAITNGPAAQRGTYVGSIRSNGSSQIDWKLGSAAAGGGEAFLGVWNMYNRVSVNVRVEDTTDSWTYQSTTVRSKNNSATNRISFISGLAEDGVRAENSGTIQTSSSAENATTAFGLDATNSVSAYSDRALGTAGTSIFSPVKAVACVPPQLGFHFLQAVEYCGGTTNPVTMYGDSGGSNMNSAICGQLRA